MATKAVDTISKDMNSNVHHFLLELVQNADDVEYNPRSEPTLTLVLKSHLRLHYNENGFAAADVRALCGIDDSTKQATASQTGEKGIGFKSVFRVAEAVWISSGNFTFRLHRGNTFEPQWCTLPFPDGSTAEKDGTTMHFQIARDAMSDVRKALETFELANMVFLKKLKRVNIRVDDSPQRQLYRDEVYMDNNARQIRILENNNPLMHYLAFDFSFAINADFVLTASREDLHRHSQWNKELLTLICGLFVKVIERMNLKNDSALRYSWPLLLDLPLDRPTDRPPGTESFFGYAARTIIDLLKGLPVLETETGDVGRPKDLVRVPDGYRLGKDPRPPVPSATAMTLHLSRKYNPDCGKYLELIGVKKMIKSTLWCDLGNFLPPKGTKEEVAEVDNLGGSQLLEHAWHRLYREWGARDISEATQDVARTIKIEHSLFDPKSSKWTQEDLISHIHFLFKSDLDCSSYDKVWVVTLSGEPHLASRTFASPQRFARQQLDVPVIHTGYFAGLNNQDRSRLMSWMHRSLRLRWSPRLVISDGDSVSLSPEMESIMERCDWYDLLTLLKEEWPSYSVWLVEGRETFQKHIRDKFASYTIRCQDDELHPLNKAIFPSDTWEKYSSIIPLPVLPIPSDGRTDWAFLTELGVKMEPNVDDWLNALGKLSCQEDSHPTRDLLSFIYFKIEESCKADLDKVLAVRKQFETQRLIFTPKTNWPSVSNAGTWVRADECVWYAPTKLVMRHCFSLSGIYYGNHDFFCDILKIDPGCNLKRLQHEAEQMEHSELDKSRQTLQYIDELLLEISGEMRKHNESSKLRSKQYEPFMKYHMLPIRFPGSQNSFDKLLPANADDEWFIADRQHLLDSFNGKIPLLALNIRDVNDASELLSLLGLDARRLSHKARASSAAVTEEEGNYAARWKARSKYIDRLVSESLRQRVPALRKLEISVYSSETVSVRWSVQGRDGTYRGKPSERIAVADLQSNILRIYVQKGQLYSARTLMELAEDICLKLRISAERWLLVPFIIAQTDGQDVESTLKFRKIPDLLDWELEQDPVPEDGKISDPLNLGQPIESQGRSPDTVPEKQGNAIPRSQAHATTSEPEFATTGTPDKTGPTPDEFHDHRLPIRPAPKGIVGPAESPTPVVKGPSTRLTSDDEANDSGGSPSSPETVIPELEGLKELLDEAMPDPQDSQNTFFSGSVAEERTPDSSEGQHSTRSQHTEAYKGIIPERALRPDRRALLSKLTPVRRLQESAVEELLLQSPLPIEKMAQQISNPTPRPKPRPPSPKELPARGSNDSTDSRGKQNKKAERAPKSPDSVRPRRLSRAVAEKTLARRTHNVARRFSGMVQASIFFRQSQQTNIFFVAKREELPDVCYEENEDPGTKAVLESRLRIPTDSEVERSVYVLMPTMADAKSRDTEFLGQVWVSQLLSNLLGSAFNPQEHWRSSFCAKVHRDVRNTQTGDEVPFQVDDTTASGALTRFLIEHSYTAAEGWQQRPPRYYIDVATTTGEHDSPVTMDSSRFHKARDYHIALREHSPKCVFIFVRISNINAADEKVRPKAAFYIDPWQLYTENQIYVTASKDKHSVVFSSKPHFWVEHVEPRVYKWRPIQGKVTIRLLRLAMGGGSDGLEGTFEYCDLDNLGSKVIPEYTAVSYAWGSALKQFSLHITNDGDSSPILLPVSLYLALKRIRQQDRTVLLWIDGICIDQYSIPEKQTQIPLLSKIFQSAKNVFAWIGEEEDGSPEAVQLLRNLGEMVLNFRKFAQQPGQAKNVLGINPDYIPREGDKTWIAVGNLLQRPWFSRIWIVQEAVLAAELTISCGGETIPWEVFHAAVSFCFMQELWDRERKCFIADERTQKNILYLGNLRAQARKAGSGELDSMFRLLQLFHQKDVTKPRDRLFALLNMSNDRREERLKPDYESCEEDVIMKYAAVFVSQGHALDLLYQARRAWERKGLPSWVPRLTADEYPRTVAGWNMEFKAAGNAPVDKDLSKPRVCNNNTVLCLRGYMIGRIDRLGNFASNTSDVILYLEDIFRSIDAIYSSKSDKARMKVKCRLPIGNTLKSSTARWNPEDEKARRTVAFRAMLDYMKRYLGKPHSNSEAREIREAARADTVVSDSGDLRRRMWPYLQTVMEFAGAFQPASAVVCETDTKRVGIVPQEPYSQVGDMIVIFHGARVPYLVRKLDSGMYRAVGECYIDGAMYGEVFDTAATGSLPADQEFLLE
ncbi:hypothetical protein DL770_004908 [Monosporascus sp. CRB-9-2]|nr:hypothetical protein DL770_004908 [Monosporascus sp. CRB-9-2]